jgi:CheY-like chemotaxis protein
MDKAPFFSLIVSNSNTILSQLRQGGFRRIDLQTSVANNDKGVLQMVNKQRPDALVLESGLPGDPFELCRHLKQDLGMPELPVVIICEGSISKVLLPKIVNSGCDEVLSAPLSRGQLYDVLAEHLGLPRRSHLRANVLAHVTARGTYVQLKGRIYDLTVSGARIRLEQPFEGESMLTVCIESSTGEELMLTGRVVWHRPFAKGAELAVQFTNVDAETARLLEVLATWHLVHSGSQRFVVLQRALTERSNFTTLVEQLQDGVVFDLRHLNLINSMGVSRWVDFLRGIPEEISFRFAHCSVAFCTQASFIPDMVGRGRVESFFAPYYCSACDREAERELSAAQLESDEPSPPNLVCPSCGEQMLFEDIPERYFRFLHPGEEE